MLFRTNRIVRALAVTSLAALALAGCSANAATPASSPSASNAPLTFTDPWIKATDSDMTGVFVTIDNTTNADIVIESADVAGAGMTELHETVVQSDGSSTMQEANGGITVPANGEAVLEPGHDHIMAMKLTKPILPGDEAEVTLTLGDGSKVSFIATAKEYTGAKETYAPQMSDSASSPMATSSDAAHEGHEH